MKKFFKRICYRIYKFIDIHVIQPDIEAGFDVKDNLPF